MTNFESKTAVITGASRGIGKAVAEALVDRCTNVVIGDLLDEQGQSVVDDLNKRAQRKVAVYQHADATKYADLKRLFEVAASEFGGVDIAIFNAGVAKDANALFTPMDGGVIKGNKVALMHMVNQGGVIINTASSAGVFPPNFLNAYGATKSAVVGWTRSLGYLQRACNVRVSAVCPYWVETELIQMAGDPNRYCPTLVRLSPKTEMQTVVDAFLKCITGEYEGGSIVLALPDGLRQDLGSPIPAVHDRPPDINTSVGQGAWLT
ncbi:hypothetical protein DFQ28_008864 [Apophysomyces sp. BC1034]|nr:hypothetical protein DFQ28_008864 [Apophysomyces sp. BC1034]